MKTESIFELARKAKIKNDCDGIWCTADQLVRFAEMIAAHEREECAKVCEQSDEDGEGPDCWDWYSKDYAAAIRSRNSN